MSTALVKVNGADWSITLSPEAHQQRMAAMCAAGEIEVVDSPATQERAVDAQRIVHTLLKDIEAQRKLVKQPLLDCGRKLDSAVKEFVTKLEAELTRVSRMLGDYQQAQEARLKSETMARNENLTELERQREAELSKASTLEEREAVHEKYSQAISALPAQPTTVKAEGQVVRRDWEFEVTDANLLARAHPLFVTITPKRLEIKEALRAGIKIVGIKAWEVVKSQVKALQ